MRHQHTFVRFLRLSGPLLLAAICLLWLLLVISPVYADGPVGLSPIAILFSGDFDPTSSVAWGDVDGDGDLDLAVGNQNNPNKVYLNQKGILQTIAGWTSDDNDPTSSVAWGDIDRDGDLDLAVGSQSAPNKIYLNQNGILQTTAVWSDTVNDWTDSVAWGDVDGDGDLDLAVGNSAPTGSVNKVYLNEGGVLQTPAVPVSNDNDVTSSVAWGDVDGDGDLDLAVGNQGSSNKVYLNQGGVLTIAAWISNDNDATSSVAWGDVDGDGDLDLAVGNLGRNKVYLNQGGLLQTAVDNPWTSSDVDQTQSIAWGDVDGDGDLDLVAGNLGNPNKVYLNEGGVLQTTAGWVSEDSDFITTTSVAWGDVDGDGDLDLVVGAANIPNRIYLNEGETLQSVTGFIFVSSTSVAWGDVDGDGDLDLAVGNDGPNKVYPNQNGMLQTTAVWSDTVGDVTYSVAWGDVDGDGDLDLAVGNDGPNKVYPNQNGMLQTTAVWSDTVGDVTYSVAWGDVDGDGDLDLAVGNYNGMNKVYLNQSGILQTTATWTSGDNDGTWSVAWGDIDGDGDLDLAAGNGDQANAIAGQPNKVYLNQDGMLQTAADNPWTSGDSDQTTGVAWGDVNGDGDLDLAAGNWTNPNKVYLNQGGVLQTAVDNPWTSSDSDFTQSVAWGDVDGDGDLDLAAGNLVKPDKIYLNQGGVLQTVVDDPWTIGGDTRSVAWGDIDRDGDLDLVANTIYLNQRPAHPLHPGQTASLALDLNSEPVQTFNQSVMALAPADFYATPGVRQSGHIPISYTLYHPDSEPVRFIKAFYSPDGGGRWLEAVATSDTMTTSLTTGPYPTATLANTHLFTWDVFGSGFLGQSDNVVFRLEAYPSLLPRSNRIPGPYQRPYVSAQTFPFRVRGSQVRVLSGTTPISNAIVYRLPAGQSSGGFPLAGSGGVPFRTDSQGYLQGRGQLDLGDRLLALAPVDWTESMTWAVGLTETMHLYYTNDTDADMIPTYTITEPGVQELVVKESNPLLLFDLDVSLEWDASTDPEKLYLGQLRSDIKEASEFLFDFTNGQAALGQVNIFQNAEDWSFSEVVVQSTNRMRPFAIQGGIVISPTLDPDHADIIYDIGQIRMGSTWNRYGDPGDNNGLDWPLTLAHELAHFLFFLDDTYLGLNEDGLLIAVDSCKGSVMGDMYNPSGENTEFLREDQWPTQVISDTVVSNCEDTLAHKTLGRSEWKTIQQRYPFLYDASNPGPNQLPFDFTTVTIFDPLTPTQALEDPTFFLDYEDGGSSSANGRAFLIKEDNYIFDLGSPISGQDRVLARGAEPGDELCIFDQPRRHYGCEMVSATDEHIFLKKDESWTPLMQVSPINSTTLTLSVSNLPPLNVPLQARLFPEFGVGSDPMTLNENNGILSGTFVFTYPVPFGHVRLWSGDREAIIGYSVGGNMGSGPTSRGSGPTSRGSGPTSRGSGPTSRGSGPTSRGSGAPIVSPDGQMIFFTENPELFKEGELYAVQSTASVPTLPAGKQLIGLSYNLVASPNVTHPISGSISFQYLGIDTLKAGITEAGEAGLTIHYWPNELQGWQALDTIRNPYYNLTSAPGQGPGIYALLAGVTPPLITTFTPTVATNDATTTLVVTGQNFLSPVRVSLLGETGTYTLPAQAVYSTTITTLIPVGLPAQEYQLVVINGDQSAAPASGTLSMFEPNDEACFYDFFESGANKWQRGGEWAIVTLKDGQNRAITDSPTHPYLSAPNPPLSHTLAITSAIFSLQACPNPHLTFRHAYDILNFSEDWGASQDMGRVEISTSSDGGATWSDWSELKRYHNGGDVVGLTAQTVESEEWSSPDLQPEAIDLSGHNGLARLRFSLEADVDISGKGWVVDDVMVESGGGSEPPLPYEIFLPIVIKNE